MNPRVFHAWEMNLNWAVRVTGLAPSVPKMPRLFIKFPARNGGMARNTALFITALSILACAASALSSSSPALLEFASYAVPSNQSFSIQQFPYQGSIGFAVVSNGEVYALFASGVPILEEQPLTGDGQIGGALSAYYSSQGNSPNLSFSDVHAGISSVSGNYAKGEAKCRVLTGTDRTACTSFDTCQKACYSVTSFCQPIALGTGRAFIEEIWEFENSSKALGEAYLNEGVMHAALLDGITHEEAVAYLDSLVALNRAATQASNSALYDGYSYCFEPDYALPVITNMQLSAQKAYARAAPFFAIGATAQQVRARTLAGMERRSFELAVTSNNTTSLPAFPEQQNRPGAGQGENASPGAASLSSPAPPDGSILPAAAALSLIIAFAAGAFLLASGRKKKA